MAKRRRKVLHGEKPSKRSFRRLGERLTIDDGLQDALVRKIVEEALKQDSEKHDARVGKTTKTKKIIEPTIPETVDSGSEDFLKSEIRGVAGRIALHWIDQGQVDAESPDNLLLTGADGSVTVYNSQEARDRAALSAQGQLARDPFIE